MPERTGFQVGNIMRTLGILMTNNAQELRATYERTRNTQGQFNGSASTLEDNRPVTAQVARFSGQISSTGYDSFNWTGGQLFVGTNLQYTVQAGSQSSLTANTSYWVYFDLDDPGSGFQVTENSNVPYGVRKVSVATLITGDVSDYGLTIVRSDGEPQLSGGVLVTCKVMTNVCEVEAPGVSHAKVGIDADGIKGVKADGVQTFEVNIDGSGQLGVTGSERSA